MSEGESLLFSIIMPTFNREKKICKAIDSVLSQKYTNYELLIIDDGSQDNTVTLVNKKYSKYINREIRIIKNKRNQGVCASRNKGLEKAKGEWIAYLDSDNTMDADFLSTFYDNIIKTEYDCMYAQFRRLSDGANGASTFFNYEKLCDENYIDIGVFVHKKALYYKYGGFNTNLKRLVDWDLILRYTKNNEPLFINKVVMTYDNLPDSSRISNTNNLAIAYNAVVKNNNIKKSKVSAIIVTYNHETYISKAIESAINQFGHNLYEIIISDDGSTDNTPSIIAEYKQKYPELIDDISRKENVGVSDNYKRCIKHAKGDYIAILEGDDYWLGNKIEEQRSFLEKNTDCVMVFSRLYTFNQNKGTFTIDHSQKIITSNKIEFKDFFKFDSLNPIKNFSCCMFVSKFLKNIPEEVYGDRLSEIPLCAYLSNYGKIGFIDHPLSVYRYHESGVWSGMEDLKKMLSSYSVRLTTKQFLSVDDKKQMDKYIINEYFSKIQFINYQKEHDTEVYKEITDLLSDKCKIINQNKRRLGLFVFHDSKGIVGDYVLYLIRNVMKYLSNLQIVCIGSVNIDERDKLSQYSDCILRIPGGSSKIDAWKAALIDYNTDAYLKSFDEIVMFDDEIYGPIYPLDSIFSGADDQYEIMAAITVPTLSNGTIERRIISSFMCFKKTVLLSSDWLNYWFTFNTNNVETVEYDIYNHFSEKYKIKIICDYYNTAVNNRCVFYNDTFSPMELITNNSPFIRRTSLIKNKKEILKQSDGHSTEELLRIIRDNYPVDYIMGDLLRKFDVVDLKNTLNLNYIITPLEDKKLFINNACIVIHIYYIDKSETILKNVKEISHSIDLFITTSDVEKKKEIKEIASRLDVHIVDIRVTQNRGREQSALLIECRDLFSKYEYLCFIHDKKSTSSSVLNYVSSDVYQNMFFNNLLTSTDHVKRIISLFDSNSKLGILSPPSPMHSIYSSSIGIGWTSSFNEMKKLSSIINLDVKLDENKSPFSLGMAFWCRTVSIEKLWAHLWSYEDFPEEPLKSDGTLLHAIERCLPYVAQDAGYYSAWAISDDYLPTFIQNSFYINEETMNGLRRMTGTKTTYDKIIEIDNKTKKKERNIIFNNNLYCKLEPQLLLHECSLFDSLWYYRMYLDNNDRSIDDPIEHYLEIGWKNNYNPGPFFDGKKYLDVNVDVKNAKVNPLVHYIRYGEKRKGAVNVILTDYELIKGSLLFSKKWYLEKYADMMEDEDPIKDYLEKGWKKGFNPSPLFDNNDYLKRYEDVKRSNNNPLSHYLRSGYKEKRTYNHVRGTTDEQLIMYSGLFDQNYYSKIIDSKKLSISLEEHYLEEGWKNKINPSFLFDGQDYLSRYKDVYNKKICPLLHYINYGYDEKRKINCVRSNNVAVKNKSLIKKMIKQINKK